MEGGRWLQGSIFQYGGSDKIITTSKRGQSESRKEEQMTVGEKKKEKATRIE